MAKIVVDTNVFLHAVDPRNVNFGRAGDFVAALKDSDAVVYVDEIFSLDEAKNASFIWNEYKTHIPPTGVSAEILKLLLATSRIDQSSRSVSAAVAKVINRNVKDPTDRVFAKVAHTSGSVILSTNDALAFTRQCVDELRKARVCNVGSPEDALLHL